MAIVGFYLDSRRPRRDGSSPLKLSVRFGRSAVMIATGVFLSKEQWHPSLLRVVNHPRRKALNSYLDSLRLNAEGVLHDLALSGAVLTPRLVRSRIVFSGGVPDDRASFLSLFREVCDDRRTKERTHELYRATLKKVLAYADALDVDPESIAFEDITRSWVDGFDAWLMDSSPSKNARNIHLRNIRHVCNVALDRHLTTFYDFRGVSIKAVPTVKRSLSVDQLRALFSLPVEEHQRKYLDFFRLIFCLIGINTIDLCHLKKSDVVDGRLEYDRSKTGRHYSIKLEPEALSLIDVYRGSGSWLLDVLDRYSNFKDFAHRLNENLQKMGEVEIGKHGKKNRSPLFPGLTTYWARHSWATIAASLDVPKETISKALGHGGSSVTDIYIDFDMRKVDEANRRVLDWVFYGKK